MKTAAQKIDGPTRRLTDKRTHGQLNTETTGGTSGLANKRITDGRANKRTTDGRVYAASSASEKTSTRIKDENVNDIASRARQGQIEKKNNCALEMKRERREGGGKGRVATER